VVTDDSGSGRDIPDIPEVKIIFLTGMRDLETEDENG
jgi:hypothetical protein